MNKRKTIASPTEIEVVERVFTDAGYDNTIQREDLLSRSGLGHRVLRAAIAELVKQGQPIIANRRGGYLLTDDCTLLSTEIRRLNKQIAQIRLRVSGLRQYYALARATH